MKTSNANKIDYICKKCGQRLCRDLKGRGFVRHIGRKKGEKDRPICTEGRGEKD